MESDRPHKEEFRMAKTSVLWALKTLNLIAFLATVGVNALANALPINGKTTGELSDLYPNLFVPAGMTFSIWGVIYLLLAIFAVYQIATPNRNAAGFLERSEGVRDNRLAGIYRKDKK